MKDLGRNLAGVSPAGFTANKTSQRPHVWNTNMPAAFAVRRWSSVVVAAAVACANKERVWVRMQIKGRQVANKQAIKIDVCLFVFSLFHTYNDLHSRISTLWHYWSEVAVLRCRWSLNASWRSRGQKVLLGKLVDVELSPESDLPSLLVSREKRNTDMSRYSFILFCTVSLIYNQRPAFCNGELLLL